MMLKYCMINGKRGSKMIERRELEDGQTFEDCFVEYPYNEISKLDCITWVENTIDEIESCDIWSSKEINKGTSFYCQNICSVCKGCSALKEFNKKYKD